jgi:putative glutamine amidotransferase
LRRSRKREGFDEVESTRAAGIASEAESGVTDIAISTTIEGGGEYAAAVAAAGGNPRLLDFDPIALDSRLAGCAGVLLSGGGDVDPALYGEASERATEVDARRDAFELALVLRARERGLPTLCICRGLQVANVAFGGTLVDDIGSVFTASTAALHRRETGGKNERGLIPGHVVSVRPQSLLAAIVTQSSLVTGSRHHQSIARVAADLDVVGSTADGIVEAVQARFPSPFWLGVQWHPESTLADDGGAGSAIFAAFVAAAERFARRHDGR